MVYNKNVIFMKLYTTFPVLRTPTIVARATRLCGMPRPLNFARLQLCSQFYAGAAG